MATYLLRQLSITCLFLIFYEHSAHAQVLTEIRINRAYSQLRKGNYDKANSLINKINEAKIAEDVPKASNVMYYYSKARLSYKNNELTPAQDNLNTAQNVYSKVSSVDRARLNKKAISKEDFNKLEEEIGVRLPSRIPFLASYNDSIVENVENYLDSTKIAQTATKVFNSLRLMGVGIPDDVKIKSRRTGKYKENLEISYSYGGDNTNIKMAAFERGQYNSPLAEAALAVLKQTLIKFINEERNLDFNDVSIILKGYSDGLSINGPIPYENEFGRINNVKYFFNRAKGPSYMRLEYNDLIDNEKLAFLRAYHPKLRIYEIPQFKNAPCSINCFSAVDTGASLRKVEIHLHIKNAYKLQLALLDTFERLYLDKVVDTRGPKSEFLGKPTYPRKKIAIVVGISDYKNLKTKPNHGLADGRIWDLKYAENDAREFIDLLQDQRFFGGGWQIRQLIGPKATKQEIIAKIKAELARTDTGDLVYIYFSGHGAQGQISASDVYLLPYDYKQNELEGTGVLYSEILNEVDKAKAKHIFLFIDACKSGAIGFGKDAKGNSITPDFTSDQLFTKIKSFPETKIIFSSATHNQFSIEDDDLKHGVYTYFLLKGLYGEAPNRFKDKYVDFEELYDYVFKNVMDFTLKQYQMRQEPRRTTANGDENPRIPMTLRIK